MCRVQGNMLTRPDLIGVDKHVSHNFPLSLI